ncbi:MAG TPA: hypothetical protein VG826_35530 [Pirellulales bacterium]|nr:hypothetical protein [Pirellulales bacterium]
MGRLLTIAIIVGTAAAILGGLTGAILLAAAAPLPEDRVWFVWLCATLTGSVAAVTASVAMRSSKRNRTGSGNDFNRALASVLAGGGAGAALAQRMFDTSPRGRQLILFAAGALVGGCLFVVHRRLRQPAQRLVDRRIADNPHYSRSSTVLLHDLHADSLPTPIVDILMERRARGRWFQFTLGSLLALTLIASLSLALWVRGPMKRRQVLTAIERSGGGRVGYATRAPYWVVDLLGDTARGIFDEVDRIELSNATDADLARLGFLSRLRSLSLTGSVTDEAMKKVVQWQSLEELDLAGTNVSTKGLAELRRLPRLQSLRAPLSIDDAGLKEIAAVTSLTKLYLDGRYGYAGRWFGVTGAGLDHLRNLAQLTELSLAYQAVADDDLAFLEQLPRLKTLRLDNTRVTDVGLRHLARLQELELLNLTRTNVTGSGFENLTALTQLRRLDLGGLPVTDRGLEGIAALTNLEMLDLTRTKITDAGLVHLKTLSRLQYLNLMFTAISDAGLPNLEELTSIEVFYHDSTNTTPAGIARLEDAWRTRRTRKHPVD